MALNIKNTEVERLVDEVVELTGETKTEAVRQAMAERRDRLAFRVTRRKDVDALTRFLEREIWPLVPEQERGRCLTRAEEDEILGYGPHGV